MMPNKGLPYYYGYNPPFFGGHQNVLSRQSGERIIKNDLLQLIMTSPGERVMRPEWGTIVKQSIFEQMTREVIDRIQANVAQAINRYEPRVRVNVNIEASPDESLLKIILVGTYTGQPNHSFELEVPVQLSQTGA